MLDIKFIRQNPEKVKEACKNKQVTVDVDRILELDKKRREETKRLEELRAEQNKISKQAPEKLEIEKAREIKEKIREVEPELERIEKEFNGLMFQIPNIPSEDVPVGKDETGNVVIRKVGKIPKFSCLPAGRNFKPKDYMEIAENLDLIDVKRAAKISGARFSYIKNELVLMHFALMRFGLDVLVKEGFIPLLPPKMITAKMAWGMGYLEQTDDEESYFLPKDNLYLIATSEQSMGAMHSGEVLPEKDLPKRYVGFTACFRREAGSYGKDTKGILRSHEFDKLEMFSLSRPGDSKKEHEYFLSLEEKLMKLLELPYQVVNICTGDLGRPAAKKYDIETWLPGQNRYRETHSTSNCTDFQTRRLNIRYKDKFGKLDFVHAVNGTAFSMRPLIAILENYQQKDGSVKIPKVLQKYLPFKVIKK